MSSSMPHQLVTQERDRQSSRLLARSMLKLGHPNCVCPSTRLAICAAIIQWCLEYFATRKSTHDISQLLGDRSKRHLARKVSFAALTNKAVQPFEITHVSLRPIPTFVPANRREINSKDATRTILKLPLFDCFLRNRPKACTCPTFPKINGWNIDRMLRG
jgi:hypothetical protein